MKNFTDFIIDSAKDSELGKICMEKIHALDNVGLSQWFSDAGYDVQADECKKLQDNKEEIKKTSEVGIGPY